MGFKITRRKFQESTPGMLKKETNNQKQKRKTPERTPTSHVMADPCTETTKCHVLVTYVTKYLSKSSPCCPCFSLPLSVKLE